MFLSLAIVYCPRTHISTTGQCLALFECGNYDQRFPTKLALFVGPSYRIQLPTFRHSVDFFFRSLSAKHFFTMYIRVPAPR